MFQLSASPMQPGISDDLLRDLRVALATCNPRRISPEARRAIVSLCKIARDGAWSPEHLVVTVKEACYSSPEFAHLTTTSERDALLSVIVTGVINEYYSPLVD